MGTAERIAEVAEDLIQKHGFHGFGFQELADRIGIRKASIYHHFPTKTELGRAVIDRYRQRTMAISTKLDQVGGIEHWSALALYLDPIMTIARTPGQACLCGVLAGEYLSLPEPLQIEVSAFFSEHMIWLARLLDSGRRARAFKFEGTPDAMAQLLFAAIEGGMLIKRSTGNLATLDDILATISQILGKDSAT